jgi:hypothetical protein
MSQNTNVLLAPVTYNRSDYTALPSVAAKMPRLTKLLWEHRTASRIPEVAFLVVLLSEEKTPLRDSVKQSCHFTASAYEIRSSLALSHKGP